MTAHELNVLWLKDILEHLSASQQQLEWTTDPDTIRLVTQTMSRDLERCQRLCETIRQRSSQRQPA
jgi:hypothetical protein